VKVMTATRPAYRIWVYDAGGWTVAATAASLGAAERRRRLLLERRRGRRVLVLRASLEPDDDGLGAAP
jgi:hypothetical protein